MKVLIVDDHPTNRKLLRAQLEAERHTVLEAADGVDALASLEREPVQAVISDILMPRLDGFRLCRAVRQSEELRGLPFILYTSTYDSPSDRQLATAIGADDYILKPAAVSVLLASIRAAQQKRLGDEPRQQVETSHEEVDVLRQYSEALVHKLEEKNSELQHALAELRKAHDEILGLNAHLERRVQERTAELTAAREAAEAANKARRDFLAAMSHEIRTPMSGMLGLLELMALKPLDLEQRETLGVVQESGKTLVRIIDDILDFSKIEAGKLDICPEPAALGEIIEGVRAIYEENASKKGLSIRCSVDPQVSPAVWIDPLRLRQILSNLVSNSIKFTDRGFIAIRAELLARADAQEHIRISVTDTGTGISAESQRELFQPFSQVAGSRRAGGTGLGLAICRRLAELMGGSMEMRSEVGTGTTVTLALSVRVAEPGEIGRSRDQPGPEDVQTMLRNTLGCFDQGQPVVLVVEDSPTNRMLLESQLDTLGIPAESTENGVEALQQWKTGRFSLVIADCNMPEMDGYELARSIRRLERTGGMQRIPIIACTASALEGEAEKCFEAGFDDFLVKPTTLAHLSRKLGQWLQSWHAGSESMLSER